MVFCEDVYFDDFKISHGKSPIVQHDEYYLFDLRFNIQDGTKMQNDPAKNSEAMKAGEQRLIGTSKSDLLN